MTINVRTVVPYDAGSGERWSSNWKRAPKELLGAVKFYFLT